MVGLPLVSVVRFVLHVVKSSPELTYLFTETLKFYWYIIRFHPECVIPITNSSYYAMQFPKGEMPFGELCFTVSTFT